MAAAFTTRQGQYLAFIHHYTQLHGRPPAETDMVRFFRVTPPSAHQMVVTLHKRGLISRVPGQGRSIRVTVPPEKIPPLPGIGRAASSLKPGAVADAQVQIATRVARRVVLRLFEVPEQLNDPALAALVRCTRGALQDELREADLPVSDVVVATEALEELAVDAYLRRLASDQPEANAEGFRSLVTETC